MIGPTGPAGSGGSGNGTTISTTGGYSVVTSANDIQLKNNATTIAKISNYTTTLFEDLSGMTSSSQYFSDNSSVNYYHK